MFARTHQGLEQEVTASGFRFHEEPGEEFGPSGFAFLADRCWLLANGGTGELFRFDGAGGEAGEPINGDAGLLDLAVTTDGRVFGTRWTLGELVEIDPVSGARLRVVADDFRALTGLVVDARTGLLIVADYEADAVYLVDPDTGRRSVRARGGPLGGPDGLAGAPDGELWVACEGNRHLVRIAADGTVSDFGAIAGGPDGIALARPEGPLAGAIIINQRDGRVTALDPNGDASVLAEGGTPGDLAAVDPHGYLHVSQLTETIRFNQPWFIPSQPPQSGRSRN
jgi:hypothetical protein